jgi:serine/threonine protein kinase
MQRLRKHLQFETAFGVYEVDCLLGEGGAGRVYGGKDANKTPIALKLLASERASTDKRKRFKNEIAFLTRNRHRNIVSVLDHGVSRVSGATGPFYVMKRYPGSLRQLMQSGIAPDAALGYYSQVLDGVEAAHLQGIVHRDIKPENVLFDDASGTLAIADFGIASFTEDIVATQVDTAPNQRLANFQYAAPEQRRPGQVVGVAADLYALGLILNEMFTDSIPLGSEYRRIEAVAKDQSYLDAIVDQLIRQNPGDRPVSVAELKGLIMRHQSEAVGLQRLSDLTGQVIPEYEVDEPLTKRPPSLVGFDWDRGQLTLTLDREVSGDWVEALRRMGNYRSIMGKGPETFTFQGNRAFVQAREGEVQDVINYFKSWLPLASQTLGKMLEQAAESKRRNSREELQRARAAEEQRLRVLRSVKI